MCACVDVCVCARVCSRSTGSIIFFACYSCSLSLSLSVSVSLSTSQESSPTSVKTLLHMTYFELFCHLTLYWLQELIVCTKNTYSPVQIKIGRAPLHVDRRRDPPGPLSEPELPTMQASPPRSRLRGVCLQKRCACADHTHSKPSRNSKVSERTRGQRTEEKNTQSQAADSWENVPKNACQSSHSSLFLFFGNSGFRSLLAFCTWPCVA